LSLLSIGMFFWLERIGERQRLDFDLCDVLMDIQKIAATAHLWLEEAITGDPAVEIQKVKDDLDLAIRFAEVALNGGESEHGQILQALRDGGLREKVEELKVLLIKSKQIALQRLNNPGAAGIGSVLDQQLDAVFKEFQEKASALEIIAEKNQIQARVQSQRLFLGIFLTWILIVSAATFGIWNREIRRKAAESALKQANDQLQVQTDELRRHEKHLVELVAERTADLTDANRSLQQEILERKESEKILQTSADRFRTLVQNLPLKIFLKDRNSVYLYGNDNWARDLSIRPLEIFGKTDYDLYPVAVAERHIQEDKRVFESGKAEEMGERYLREGQEFVFWKIKVPIKNELDDRGNLLGIVWDVTEKIRLESIAEAANAMENIGYIFAGIRHEIGNPINAIKITLRVLKSKLNQCPVETIQEYTDRVLAEISKMEYLLRALKNFNMYETLAVQSIFITSFMDRFLSLARIDFEQKGIRIRSLVQPEAQTAYADPRALQQVLLNTLSNAADALAGTENPEITIRVLKMDGSIRIRVTDNGCGMTEQQQKELFKPFRTTKPGGTGLGLVIARKMLTGMNGAIEVKSAKGSGTTVDISLPGEKHENSRIS